MKANSKPDSRIGRSDASENVGSENWLAVGSAPVPPQMETEPRSVFTVRAVGRQRPVRADSRVAAASRSGEVRLPVRHVDEVLRPEQVAVDEPLAQSQALRVLHVAVPLALQRSPVESHVLL